MNGAIHWLLSLDPLTNLEDLGPLTKIVAFDLAAKTFSTVYLPIYFENDPYILRALTVLKEMLHLSAIGESNSVEIWVMREYHVESSWTRTIVVPRANFHQQMMILLAQMKVLRC